MAQRGVDYWTTEDQPFITKDMLFGGIGSMARALFVPREADLQRFPRFVTDPRVGLPPPTNRNLSEKKKKLAVKAVERGVVIEGIHLVEKSGGQSGHYRKE